MLRRPRWREYLRAETAWFLGPWLALMVAGRSRMFRDPGTFWHVALGRIMLTAGRPIDSDPFSFTRERTPWIPHSWLAECLMAAMHRVGGLDGLLLGTVTILACLYAWAACRLLRAGLHGLPTLLLVALAIAAGAAHFHVRPHIATIVGLGLTCGLLADVESGRAGPGRLAWLVPLFVAWSNLHGGMPAGLATLGFVVLGWGGYRLVGLPSPIRAPAHAAWLAALVVACGLASLVNPYGLRLPGTWLEIIGSPLLPQIIEEHAPPRGGERLMILLLGLAYGAVLAGTWPRPPRITWLVPLIWLFLALSRVRHAPLFSISALIVLADMLPCSRLAAWLARPGRDLFRTASVAGPGRRLAWKPLVLPLAVVASAGLSQAAGVEVPILGRGWARLDPELWPTDLLPDLRRCEAEHPEGSRILNEYELGGFLIYYVPGIKVFIDDRCELYGDWWLDRFWTASYRDPELIDPWVEQYQIQYALVRTDSLLDQHLARSPGWSVEDRCRAATFYRRGEARPGRLHTIVAERASRR